MIQENILKIRIKLLEPMLGTIPKNKDVYTKWVQSKAPTTNDGDEAETVPEDLENSGWTGFHTDEDGIFIYDYMIMGFLKNAGNILKDQLKIKNLRSKIENYVKIEPRRIRLYYAGTQLKEPAGFIERSLRAQTSLGPRVALAKSDYVPEGTELDIIIKIINNKEVTAEVITNILEYGQYQGLGQFRGGGYGRFTYDIIK